MRMRGTFVLIALVMIIQGACAWWAAAVRGMEPVIMSFGAAFAAIGLKDWPSHDVQHFKPREYISEYRNKITGKEWDPEIEKKYYDKWETDWKKILGIKNEKARKQK